MTTDLHISTYSSPLAVATDLLRCWRLHHQQPTGGGYKLTWLQTYLGVGISTSSPLAALSNGISHLQPKGHQDAARSILCQMESPTCNPGLSSRLGSLHIASDGIDTCTTRAIKSSPVVALHMWHVPQLLIGPPDDLSVIHPFMLDLPVALSNLQSVMDCKGLEAMLRLGQQATGTCRFEL